MRSTTGSPGWSNSSWPACSRWDQVPSVACVSSPGARANRNASCTLPGRSRRVSTTTVAPGSSSNGTVAVREAILNAGQPATSAAHSSAHTHQFPTSQRDTGIPFLSGGMPVSGGEYSQTGPGRIGRCMTYGGCSVPPLRP
ncbi:hypothetical protein D3C71_1016570 [compost metagenome]